VDAVLRTQPDVKYKTLKPFITFNGLGNYCSAVDLCTVFGSWRYFYHNSKRVFTLPLAFKI